MSDSEHPERRIVHLNALGKVVWFGGAAARFTARAVEDLVERSARVVAESERAFRRELDPDIEDAVVIDESGGDDCVGERGG